MRQNLNNKLSQRMYTQTRLRLRNSANRKPGDSMRGVKRKLSYIEIIGGIKKQRKWRDPDQKTNDYIMLCILSNMSVNYQHL